MVIDIFKEMWIAVFVDLKISAYSNSWKIRYYMRYYRWSYKGGFVYS